MRVRQRAIGALVVLGAVAVTAACSSSTASSPPVTVVASSTSATTSPASTNVATTATSPPTTIAATTTAPVTTLPATTTTVAPTIVDRVQRNLLTTQQAIDVRDACGQPDPGCVGDAWTAITGDAGAAALFSDLGAAFPVQVIGTFGRVALVSVVDPWRANGNDSFVLVGGVPTVQFLSERLYVAPGQLGPAYRFLLAEGGQAEGDGSQAYYAKHVREDDGRDSFVFVVPLTSGCRACGTGVAATVTFSVDGNGREAGVDIGAPCAPDPTDAERLELTSCPSPGFVAA